MQAVVIKDKQSSQRISQNSQKRCRGSAFDNNDEEQNISPTKKQKTGVDSEKIGDGSSSLKHK